MQSLLFPSSSRILYKDNSKRIFSKTDKDLPNLTIKPILNRKHHGISKHLLNLNLFLYIHLHHHHNSRLDSSIKRHLNRFFHNNNHSSHFNKINRDLNSLTSSNKVKTIWDNLNNLISSSISNNFNLNSSSRINKHFFKVEDSKISISRGDERFVIKFYE